MRGGGGSRSGFLRGRRTRTSPAHEGMAEAYDEVEIEDMEWSEELAAFTYQCPCGDLFQITLVRPSVASRESIDTALLRLYGTARACHGAAGVRNARTARTFHSGQTVSESEQTAVTALDARIRDSHASVSGRRRSWRTARSSRAARAAPSSSALCTTRSTFSLRKRLDVRRRLLAGLLQPRLSSDDFTLEPHCSLWRQACERRALCGSHLCLNFHLLCWYLSRTCAW